jgi:hypothetical protein
MENLPELNLTWHKSRIFFHRYPISFPLQPERHGLHRNNVTPNTGSKITMSFPINPSSIRSKEDMAETEIHHGYVKKKVVHALKKWFYTFMREPFPAKEIDQNAYKAEVSEARIKGEQVNIEKEQAK